MCLVITLLLHPPIDDFVFSFLQSALTRLYLTKILSLLVFLLYTYVGFLIMFTTLFFFSMYMDFKVFLNLYLINYNLYISMCTLL